MKLLSQDEIDRQSATLAAHWQIAGDTLICELEFKHFIEAFSFMTAIAMHAEKMNHHPRWINVYNKLTIELSTHDAGGLTGLDFELAGLIDNELVKFRS